MKLRLVFLWLFFAVCGTLKAYVPSDYVAVIDGIRTYIRMPHGADSVCAVLYCHRNMTEEVLFRSDNFCRQMDRLGVAMAFIQDGSQNWDVTKGCQERFEKIMADFASGTGHPEIVAAPVIPRRPHSRGILPHGIPIVRSVSFLFTAMLRARTFAVTVVRISSGDVPVISTAYRG